MDKTSEPIRIVVPVYNADKTIEKCIESIYRAAGNMEHWELIVVDNGMNDNLEKLLHKYPVQIIRDHKVASAAYARNVGAALFSHGILVFIDSDVIVEARCLNRLVKPIMDKTEVATIGNYSTDVEGLNFAQRYKQLYIHHIYSNNDTLIKNDFWTAISAIDATVFHQLNGFNCSFLGANGEDQEFGIRLTQNDYSVASIPNANGKHINPYTIKKLIRNDFKKGVKAMSNCLENQVPLKDNRHAKLRSIYAVFFAFSFAFSIIISGFNLTILWGSLLLFAIWFMLRLNLVMVYLESQSPLLP